MAKHNGDALLKINQKYLNYLFELKKRVEDAMVYNSKINNQLNTIKKRTRTHKSTSGLKIPGEPFFALSRNEFPPPNEDTLRILREKQLLKEASENYKQPKWTVKHNSALRLVVCDMKRVGAIAKAQSIITANKDQPLTAYEENLSLVNLLSASELEQLDSSIDWHLVAQAVNGDHSPESCRLRWKNYMSPEINKSNWTAEEDQKLLGVVANEGGYNWTAVAEGLQTNRSPFACLSRWQQEFNPSLTRISWKPAELQRLNNAVLQFGCKNWQLLATFLDCRSPQQCLQKLRNIGKTTKQPWTIEEEGRLILAVKACGPEKWMKVCQYVPGRKDSQCRERYKNCIDPTLSKDEWTPDEDTLLIAAVYKSKGKWAEIAKHPKLCHRTDNQLRRRWEAVSPHSEVEELKRNSKKRRPVEPEDDKEAKAMKKSRKRQRESDGEDESSSARKIPKRQPQQKSDLAQIKALDGLTFPPVLPSQATYTVLGRVLSDIDTAINEESTQRQEEEVTPTFPSSTAISSTLPVNVNTRSFKLMAAWFNSVFLFPALAFQDLGILDTQTTDDKH